MTEKRDRDEKDGDASQGIKVNDKRRFDGSGNERSEENTVKPKSAAAPHGDEFVMQEKPEQEGSSAINFSSFMMSLATQALMQLGEISPPAGIDVPVDRTAAKQTIDIIEMLQQKSRGNLDPTEARLIEEILHQLRMSYVKKV